MCSDNRIKLLLAKAWSKRVEGNYPEAAMNLAKVRSLVGDDCPTVLAKVFHIERQLEVDQENLPKALTLGKKSLEFFRKTGSPRMIAHAIRHVADIESSLDLWKEAKKNYEESIQVFRSADSSPLDLANALRAYALLLEKTGDVKEAIHYWTEVRELYRKCKIDQGVEEAQQKLSQLEILE